MQENNERIGMNIDAIFNMHKVRFDDMDTFMMGKDGYLAQENPDEVHIFINLEDIYRTILCIKGEDSMLALHSMDNAKKMIISNVINLAQHYRLYFAKLRIPNKVFLYWNYNRDKDDYKNSKYIYDYRSSYDAKIGNMSPFPYLRDVITQSLQTLQTIITYVNEVYLITHNTIESSVIPYMFYQDQVDDKKYMNVLISRDAYDYQYALYGFYVINPKKYRVITESSLLLDYSIHCKWKKMEIDIPLNFIPTLMSILGDSNKGIPKIKYVSVSGLCKIIRDNIFNLKVTPNTSSLDIIETIFEDIETREEFHNNYHCTCIPLQYQEITPNERFEIFSQVVDKYDDISLEFLNERFFTQYPLMIVDSKSRQLLNEGNL